MLAPFLLGLLNTYLTLNSLSILAILSKYFEFRFTFCAHFRNLEGLEGFHSLCLQHLANTGPHRLSILTNFHFIARKPATSKTLNFHFNEFPFHRECTVVPDQSIADLYKTGGSLLTRDHLLLAINVSTVILFASYPCLVSITPGFVKVFCDTRWLHSLA